MTNMWDAATIDYEQERLDGFIAAATVAVAEQHGFVIQASSRQEFEDRLALVASAVENTVGRVTYTEPGSFPAVHQAVLASWERDFDLITEQRQIETQRRNARRAFFRRQAGPAADWSKGWARPVPDTNPDGGPSVWGTRILPDGTEVKLFQGKGGRIRYYDAQGNQHGEEQPSVAAGFAYAESQGWHDPNSVRNHFNPIGASKSEDYAKTLIDDKDDSGELIDWAKEKAKRESSLRAFGALSCPKCKADVSTGAKIFDHGDHEVLKAKCDSCGWSGSKKKQKKSAGFKVVDDSSGASTGTVYPNKEIAEQANYGDGYSVQYTDEKVKTASLKTAKIEWGDVGPVEVNTYNGLTEKVLLWVAEEMGVTADIITLMGGYSWYVHSADNPDGSPLAEGQERTLERAKAMAERAMMEHSTQMSLFASRKKTAAYGYTDNEDYDRGYDSRDPDMNKPTSFEPFRVEIDCPACGARSTSIVSRMDQNIYCPSCGERQYGDSVQMIASKTAGENPFAKKDDEKKPAPKDDTTDSDADGEQDGPTQPGEQPEPKGDDQQAAPADPAAPQQDPAKPDVAQDKGQAQDPASAADTTQDQQQPADPTVMDVGQSTNMGFTMVEGGSSGSIEVTFVREENGVYFFNGPTGEFGVGQMNGQWQDADGNTFTFGGAPAQEQGIAPAQEQAAAADAATPTPTPAGNVQQPAPADSQQAPPAQDAAPAEDAKSDDSGEKKDDGEKKENPFAKKSSGYPSSFGNQGYEHIRSLMELTDVPVTDWSDKELLAHLHVKGASAEARKRNIWG